MGGGKLHNRVDHPWSRKWDSPVISIVPYPIEPLTELWMFHRGTEFGGRRSVRVPWMVRTGL